MAITPGGIYGCIIAYQKANGEKPAAIRMHPLTLADLEELAAASYGLYYSLQFAGRQARTSVWGIPVETDERTPRDMITLISEPKEA